MTTMKVFKKIVLSRGSVCIRVGNYIATRYRSNPPVLANFKEQSNETAVLHYYRTKL